MNEEVTSILAEIIRETEKRHGRLRQTIGTIRKLNQSGDLTGLLAAIRQNEDLLAKDAPRLLELYARIEKSCEDARLRFDADLKDALLKEGWTLSGQWPNYYVNYLIPVTLNDQKSQVTVGDEKPFNFSASRIVSTVRKLTGMLKISPKEQASFLRELLDGFTEMQKSRKASISIWDAYKCVVINRQPRKFWRNASRANFHSLPILQFRALLTGLLQTNTTQVSGYQLRLLPPIAREESVYIYDPAEGRFIHVGRMQFTQERG